MHGRINPGLLGVAHLGDARQQVFARWREAGGIDPLDVRCDAAIAGQRQLLAGLLECVVGLFHAAKDYLVFGGGQLGTQLAQQLIHLGRGPVDLGCQRIPHLGLRTQSKCL